MFTATTPSRSGSLNLEWVQHSSFDSLPIDAGENNALLPSRRIDTSWRDNWTYGLSAEWEMSPEWTFRTGAVWLQSPVPSRTLFPSSAEQDQGVVSVGLGYAREGHRFDVAYSLGVFSGRTVRGNDEPDFDGKYDFEAHLFSVAYWGSF